MCFSISDFFFHEENIFESEGCVCAEVVEKTREKNKWVKRKRREEKRREGCVWCDEWREGVVVGPIKQRGEGKSGDSYITSMDGQLGLINLRVNCLTIATTLPCLLSKYHLPFTYFWIHSHSHTLLYFYKNLSYMPSFLFYFIWMPSFFHINVSFLF